MNVLPTDKIRQLEGLYRQGSTARSAARQLGISKLTSNRYYRFFATSIGPVLCACGKSAGHRGWCRVRFRRSLTRQKVIERLTNRRGIETWELERAALLSSLEDMNIAPIGSPEYNAALLFLAAWILGQKEWRLAAALEMEQATVEEYAGRLRKAGIWTADGGFAVDFCLDGSQADQEMLEVSLALYAMVAVGRVEIVGQRDGQRVYQLTGQPTNGGAGC